MDPTPVTPARAKEMYDRGEVTFVDSRNPEAWAQSSVKLPGAIRIPADEVEEHLKEIPRDRVLVTYCT